MNRRSFISGILASCAAPAIVRAGSLMPIIVPRQDLRPRLLVERMWIDEREVHLAGINRTLDFVPTQGGFLVPKEFSTEIITLTFEALEFPR